MPPENLHVFKILIAGDSGVGKTTAVTRYVDGIFLKDTQFTIGVDFSLKNIELVLDSVSKKNLQVVLQIWDVAGESRFRNIIPYYFSGTQGIVLTFDCTNPSTLGSLNEWLDIIHKYYHAKLPIILISTKHDLKSNINIDELKEFQKLHDIEDYYPTSSLNGDNINIAFNRLAELIAESMRLM